MSQDTLCCICLNKQNKKHCIKILSCNHTLHYKCYIKLCLNKSTFFIDCPLCRNKNLNTDFPHKCQTKNLYELCCNGVGKHFCYGKTKCGGNCKNRSQLFNYGYCHIHNKETINKRYHNIFLTYIKYLFTSNKKGFRTKLYMIDMAKKIIIKRDIKKLEDIIIIFTTYFEKYDYSKQGSPNKFYEEHNLELPPNSWIDFCCEKKILF